MSGASLQNIVEHLQRGEYSAAVTLVQAALRERPGDPALQEILAVALYESGQTQAAAAAFAELVKLFPDDAQAHCNLAQVLTELGELEPAAGQLQRAIAIDPGLDAAHNALGNIHRAMLRTDDAARAYRQAVALDENNALYLCNLGVIEAALGQYEQAAQHLSAAIELAPEFIEAINNYAAVLQQLQQFDQATEQYQRALALDPQRADTLNNLGACCMARGEREQAGELFWKALALDPRYAGAHINLAALAEDDDDLPAAIEHYTQALALDPHNPHARCNQGALYLRLGQLAQAVTAFNAALAADPNYGLAHAGMADAHIASGDLSAAGRYLEQAAALIPDSGYFYEVKARLHEALDEADQAVAAYRQAIEYSQDKNAARFALALFYTRHGDYDLAEREFQGLTDTHDAQVTINWAAMEEKRNRLQRAQALLAQAGPTIDGPNSAYHLLSSKLAFRNKDYQGAAAALDLIKMEGIHGNQLKQDVYFQKGRVLDKLAQYDQAFACFEQANALRASSIGANKGTQLWESCPGYEEVFSRVRPPKQRAASPLTPIFIVGFPRSGTTLLEQIIASHPAVIAGDELPFIFELVGGKAQALLASDKSYPQCLLDIDARSCGILREHYLKRIKGMMRPGVNLITDKMPLNLTQLGLIHLLFPAAPVIHILRHPLDACLSTFASNFTRLRFSVDLQQIARQYVRAMELAAFYKKTFDLNYMELRYEALLDDPELLARSVIEFTGLQWDPQCLNFHQSERIASTESYAQVTEKLYTSSRFRYKHYQKHVNDIVPVLRPTIAALGYRLDQ